MDWRLGDDGAVRGDLRKLAARQLAVAAGAAEGRGVPPGEQVHQVRTSLKKVRALLRLVQADVGGKRAQRERRALRDLGQRVSAFRDSQVLIQTIQAFAVRHPAQADRLAPLELLAVERHAEGERELNRGGTMADLSRALRDAEGRAARWPIRHRGWRAIRCGLEQGHRAARRLARRTGRHASAIQFHEWRKAVKNHLYQVRLLAWVAPWVEERRRHVDALAEHLGHEHDLCLFRAFVCRDSIVAGARGGHDELLARIDTERDERRAQAVQIGGRSFPERPRTFERRLRRAWRAARR